LCEARHNRLGAWPSRAANYEGETPGVKAKLCRMLMTGKLGGTGKMIILPVDQGFEHGPARSFAPNPAATIRITTTSWPSTPG
jgi:DhnA family fructose-bisphosphate aldolase class Ia